MLLGNNNTANSDFSFWFSFWVCLTTPHSHKPLTWGFPSRGCKSHTEPIKQLVGGLGIAFKGLYKKPMLGGCVKFDMWGASIKLFNGSWGLLLEKVEKLGPDYIINVVI